MNNRVLIHRRNQFKDLLRYKINNRVQIQLIEDIIRNSSQFKMDIKQIQKRINIRRMGKLMLKKNKKVLRNFKRFFKVKQKVKIRVKLKNKKLFLNRIQ